MPGRPSREGETNGTPLPEHPRDGRQHAGRADRQPGAAGGELYVEIEAVCAEAAKGSTVSCLLPDTGERDLSTPFFADIPAEMTPEAAAISRSTPSSQRAAAVN